MVAGALKRERCFSGLRPIDPGRDLPQVAALIESAFGEHLDRPGQQALRQLKAMTRLGPLLWLVDRVSYEFHEFFDGFVWVEEGRIVGNVTVNRGDEAGRKWRISNLAVAEEFRGRGIARQLMEAACDMARQRGGEAIFLEVRADNPIALHLYTSMGFTRLTASTTLMRPAQPIPLKAEVPSLPTGYRLRRCRHRDWRKVYHLALAAIPKGAQWVRPLREDHFRPEIDLRLSRWLENLFTGRVERRWAVVVERRFAATLTVRASRWWGEHRLSLMVHPEHRGPLESPLVGQAMSFLRRFAPRPAEITVYTEHQAALEALLAAGFVEQRTLVLMRKML